MPAAQRPPAELGIGGDGVDDGRRARCHRPRWRRRRGRGRRTTGTRLGRRSRPADAGPARGRRARAADRGRADGRRAPVGVDEQRPPVPRDAPLPRPRARPRRGVHLQAGDGRAAARRLPGRHARPARGRGVRGLAGQRLGHRPADRAARRPVRRGHGPAVDQGRRGRRPGGPGDRRGRAAAPVAVFDAAVNNTDRKAGHLLPVPGGHVYGVDHGVTFSPVPKLRTVLWGWRGLPLAEDRAGGAADAPRLPRRRPRRPAARRCWRRSRWPRPPAGSTG